MKTIKIIAALIILVSLLSSCGEKEISLTQKGDNYYLLNSEELYTGKCIEYYPDGKKFYEGYIENGKKEGLWIWYYSNGQKRLEETYSNGLLNGARIGFDESGKETFKTSYTQGYKS